MLPGRSFCKLTNLPGQMLCVINNAPATVAGTTSQKKKKKKKKGNGACSWTAGAVGGSDNGMFRRVDSLRKTLVRVMAYVPPRAGRARTITRRKSGRRQGLRATVGHL